LKTFTVHTKHVRLLADTYTPVSLYLKLRDRFVNCLLLESSDYHGNENAFTFICCEPVASFQAWEDRLRMEFPDGSSAQLPATERGEVVKALNGFARSFISGPNPVKFINNGLFGYMSYDAVRHFEDVQLRQRDAAELQVKIPLIMYQAFRFIIAINHFNDELYIFEHSYSDKSGQMFPSASANSLEMLLTLISTKNFASYNFQFEGEEESNYTDQEFLDIIAKGKHHCQQGDVFQIVLSRRFSRRFSGDEFNVYRALRSINPSPYLFYFDYGNFRIFGSSPESQLVISKGEAVIYPIAGTFKRTGNDLQDAEAARLLMEDPKENAEHIMLVDLARNDLSKHCDDVQVVTYKEVQFFSHVIHLVSKIKGRLRDPENAIQIVADTFPAGTLSGAPKHRAIQLIDRYESLSRTYYGGCIGFMGFNGDFNQAIMIRSFLSTDNRLHYQAGAGVVFKSDDTSELEEVNNKLRALRTALQLAVEM
jgi:anthranilate synthase component 1